MQISFSHSYLLSADSCLVVGVWESGQAAKSLHPMDDNFLKSLFKTNLFKGKRGESSFYGVNPSGGEGSLLLIGLGKEDQDFSEQAVQELGGKIAASFNQNKVKKGIIDWQVALLKDQEKSAALVAMGFELRNWRFDLYKTQKKDDPVLESLTVVTSDPEAAQNYFQPLKGLAEGIFLTRHTVSEPPNVLYPETMAERALELQALGVKVEVLGEEDMKKLGMNALLGVGQGSLRESKLIVLQWLNGSKNQAPVAIVGKGVTFDSGGISIKPANGMEDMKYDMAGAGVVLGLVKGLALRQAKVNVVGVMGMVENMPSGSAQRPADVVKSMSGQTIEVINTDAEGRLVLADALWYTQDRFKPQAMIDLATLTGAIRIALGEDYAGLFSNNDALAGKLAEAGQTVQELLWRLPMGETYDRDIDSDIADVKNTGSGRGAGSITAAQFLQRFVNDVPWAHLDIASVSWKNKDQVLSKKGATGFGVRLLNEWLQKNYED